MLDFAGTRQRGEHDLAMPGDVGGAAGFARSAQGERCGRRGPEIANRELVAGVDQAQGHRRTHRAGADETQPHRTDPYWPEKPSGGRVALSAPSASRSYSSAKSSSLALTARVVTPSAT